jgi:hypothetical protein
VLHSRTKHIEVRYHFLRDNVEKGNMDLIHVPTEKQHADILTKPLDQVLGSVDVHMHVAFSFMYHIMFACFTFCIIDCFCIVCHRDVLLSYALITMTC